MSRNMFEVFADKSHIMEICLIPEEAKGSRDICLEIIPLEIEGFRHDVRLIEYFIAYRTLIKCLTVTT